MRLSTCINVSGPPAALKKNENDVTQYNTSKIRVRLSTCTNVSGPPAAVRNFFCRKFQIAYITPTTPILHTYQMLHITHTLHISFEINIPNLPFCNGSNDYAYRYFPRPRTPVPKSFFVRGGGCRRGDRLYSCFQITYQIYTYFTFHVVRTGQDE